jgi:hypothetical protein
VAAARGLRPEPGSVIRRRRLSGGRRGFAQLLFDSLAEVLDQMKAVGDLPRLRRPQADSLSIEAAAIPDDDLDFRVLLSQRAVASAERSDNTSTTSRRSRSTMIVP